VKGRTPYFGEDRKKSPKAKNTKVILPIKAPEESVEGRSGEEETY